MKKYLLTLCLMFSIVLSGTAQSVSVSMTGNADTITDVETDYVTISPDVFYEQISFQAVVTKISGTVAGTALLQSSNDGTNFKDVNTDTLTFTNVTTNTKVWVLTYNTEKHYRIKFTSSGTMSAKIYGYAFVAGGKSKHAVSNMYSSYGTSSLSDTIVNTATGYVGIPLSNYYDRVSIHALVTKISGTVAGTVTVQGSIDGTNYVTVSSSYSTAQTLSTTNTATQSKIFVITGSPYKYYRLSYTGSGSMSATLKGYVVPNR